MRLPKNGAQLSQAVWMEVKPCFSGRVDLAGAIPVLMRVAPILRESGWVNRKA